MYVIIFLPSQCKTLLLQYFFFLVTIKMESNLSVDQCHRLLCNIQPGTNITKVATSKQCRQVIGYTTEAKQLTKLLKIASFCNHCFTIVACCKCEIKGYTISAYMLTVHLQHNIHFNTSHNFCLYDIHASFSPYASIQNQLYKSPAHTVNSNS